MSIFLIFSFCCALNLSANANQYSTVDSSVIVLTPESIPALFDTENITEQGIESVSYSYTFTPCSADSTSADVTLSFSINSGSMSIPCFVSGVVTAYPLESGNVFWEGPLRGNVVIQGTNVLLLSSFSKMSTSDEVQITLTMQPQDNSLPFTLLAFGNDIMTDEVAQELGTDSSNCPLISELPEVPPIGLTSSDGFNLISHTSAFLPSPHSGSSQLATCHFESSTNRVAVSLRSFTNNVNTYYADLGSAFTCIETFTIELIRTGTTTGNNHSWIAGIEQFDFLDTDFGNANALISGLFSDAMSMLGIPSATISALLDGLHGMIERSHSNTTSSNRFSVTCTFGLLDEAIFDNSPTGVPIIFQLDRNYNGAYSGNSAYDYSTSIEYRTVLYIPYSSYPLYYYTDGGSATGSILLTLS